MNRFKNLFLLGYALFVIGMLAVSLTFVACSDSGDDTSSGNGGNGSGGSNTALAVFTCNTDYDKRTLTFYADSTFKVIVSDEPEPQAVGTYTLDSGNWENGTITLNATSGSKVSAFTGTETISEKKITFSSKTYTLTGGTRKTPSESSESGTKQDEESGANDSGNGNDGNNNNGNGGAATNTGTATFTSSEFYGGTIKIEYKADGTYLMTWSGFTTTNKGKGTYTLTGTFENGTIHQHQTHSSDTLNSNWIEDVEDNNLVVTNGSFTVRLEDNDGVENVTFTKTTSSSTGGSSDAGAGSNNGNGGASSDTGSSDSTEEIQLAFNSEELNNKIYRYTTGRTDDWRYYIFTENKCYSDYGYTINNTQKLADNCGVATSDKTTVTVTKKGSKYYVSDSNGSNREINYIRAYTIPTTAEHCLAHAKMEYYRLESVDTTTRFDDATKVDGTTDLVVAYSDGTFKFAGISRESTLYLLTPDKKYMACFVKRSALKSSLFDSQNDGYIMIGYYDLNYSSRDISASYMGGSKIVTFSVVLDGASHSLGRLPVKFLPAILKGYKIYSDSSCTQEITDWSEVQSSVYAKLDS
ncbi:MAG: hypothetical protein IJT42_03410 [Treponema sp.]|nr:hypothetical protein [Treponema sp.]